MIRAVNESISDEERAFIISANTTLKVEGSKFIDSLKKG